MTEPTRGPESVVSVSGEDGVTITGSTDQSGANRRTGPEATPFSPPRRISELRVWAPEAVAVRIVTDSADGPQTPMLPDPDAEGWWMADPTCADDRDDAAGRRYGFRLDKPDTDTASGDHESDANTSGTSVTTTKTLPDPRTVRQPDGVHELSALYRVDEAMWTDTQWRGRPVHGAVIYEMHVGTFTSGGTLLTAIERLDDLVDLGVDFVELMPLNAFNGVYNWGYDGVDWYAVHEAYGGPDALVRFVDACHARGLGVVLDVVYNHLGPSGNYLPDFGPYLSAADTGWGNGINLSGPDSDAVRSYILENALRWFAEFHIDALRLDAVHALVDHRAVPILEALAIATDALSAQLGRPLSLIAESDLNDPRLIVSRDVGGYGLTAQWDDDIHHAIHTVVSGETQGYYRDFGSLAALAKVLRGGFFHDGTYSSFRRRHHGRPIPTNLVDATSLVAYTCNHDQIGNRAIGDRPSAYLSGGQLAIKAALVLLSPFTPMLFMGEEWGASTPFAFFTSHPEPELAEAVRTGRRSEFAAHGWNTEEIPDPQDRQTFIDSRLDWDERGAPDHARVLDFYRALIALRKAHKDFTDSTFAGVSVEYDETAGWFAMHRGDWTVVCLLGSDPVDVPLAVSPSLSWAEPEITGGGLRSPGHNVVVGTRT
ncbi:malto-oligosyltrehalose trehalohydrolase [Gordonia sp. NPDC003425]